MEVLSREATESRFHSRSLILIIGLAAAVVHQPRPLSVMEDGLRGQLLGECLLCNYSIFTGLVKLMAIW
jgi:hypothetical protein